MKKKIALLLITTLLTVTSVVPAFATVTDINAEKAIIANHMSGITNSIITLVSYDNNCGEAAKQSMDQLVDSFAGSVKWSITQEEANYLYYLQACVGNALETEKIKNQNVGSMQDLVKVNPGFQPQLDAAIAEYNKAVADRMAAEAAVVDAKAQFDALNAALVSGVQVRHTEDPDAKYVD